MIYYFLSILKTNSSYQLTIFEALWAPLNSYFIAMPIISLVLFECLYSTWLFRGFILRVFSFLHYNVNKRKYFYHWVLLSNSKQKNAFPRLFGGQSTFILLILFVLIYDPVGNKFWSPFLVPHLCRVGLYVRGLR